MDFKSAEELLMLCEKNHCSISEVMKQREMELGETSAAAVEKKMAAALNIMRESAYTPIRRPQRSIGGLIGGEAKLLRKHKNAGKDICGGSSGSKYFHGTDRGGAYCRLFRNRSRTFTGPAGRVSYFRRTSDSGTV